MSFTIKGMSVPVSIGLAKLRVVPNISLGVQFDNGITIGNGNNSIQLTVDTSPPLTDIIYTVTNGTLPAGITLSSFGLLNGVTSEPGTPYNFTVTATDPSSGTSVSFPFRGTVQASSINVQPPIPIPTVNGSVSFQVPATSSTNAPLTYSSNNLPSGLSLSPSGAITGTVNGSYSFSVSITDGSVTTTQIFQGNTADVITFTNSALTLYFQQATDFQVTATSSFGLPVRYSLIAGSLPVGITFTPRTGMITGAPVYVGNFNFTILATDGTASNTVDFIGSIYDPYYANTSLMLHFQGNYADSAGHPLRYSVDTSHAGNGLTSSGVFGYGLASNGVNGNGMLYYSPSPDFALSGDFTVECWINTSVATLTGGYRRRILATCYVNNVSGTIFDLLLGSVGNPNDGRLALQQDIASNGIDYIVSPNSVADGQWHFIAVCRSGSNLMMYIDGNQVASTTCTVSFAQDGVSIATMFTTGSSQWYGNFNGIISEVRMTKGVCRYSGPTCPVPTEPFPAN